MRTRSSLAICLLAALLFASPASAATIFFQDFESGLGGNESNAGLFVINNTGFGNNGTNMMGHREGYTDNEFSYYQLVLDLTGATSAFMSFDYRGSFEAHFDRFIVRSTLLLTPLATSGMQFIDLGDTHHPNLGRFAYDTSAASGGSSGIAMFDLTSLTGAIVTLRFQFGSDESITGPGFNMDNLLIEGDVAAVPEPATMWLVGAGAATLAARRARRRVK
jgi:hypothetical protein